jgi:ADP-ribosylglycohydrolase
LTSVTNIQSSSDSNALDRAYAVLAGLAVGDALGMPTQALAREDVVKDFGMMIESFQPSSPAHPFAAGLAAGTVTDDTEQALILAELLLENHEIFDARRYARKLLEWEQSVRQRGLSDLLGPSTKQALLNIELGMDLEESGRSGTTNGAAMRIAPAGIRWPTHDLKGLVHHVVQISAITHNTSVALSAAAAVAAVVSAGIEGLALEDALDFGVRAGEMAQNFGDPTPGADLPARIVAAMEIGRAHEGVELIDAIIEKVGTSVASQESVPAAFAVLVSCRADSWSACRLAASLGGDSDTIAAMAGAMSGACNGSASFPAGVIDLVETKNSLDLKKVAFGLMALRR